MNTPTQTFKNQLSHVKNYCYVMTESEHLKEIVMAEEAVSIDPFNEGNFSRLVCLKLAYFDFYCK